MAAAMGARRTATTFDRFSDRTLADDLSVQTADPLVSLAVDDAAEVVAVGRTHGLPFVFPSIDGKLPIMRARDAAIIAWDPVMGTEVDRPLILEGRALRPGRGEVLINDAWAQSFEYGSRGRGPPRFVGPP